MPGGILFNDAQCDGLDKVPTVATTAPRVVLARSPIDHLHSVKRGLTPRSQCSYSPISRTVRVFVVEFPLLSVTVRSKM